MASAPEPPFSRAAFTSNCWVSLLHAILMQFLWRASFLEAVASFSFIRPIHSITLLSWAVSVMFFDPHESNRVLLNAMTLDKAIIAFVCYVGALISLRSIVAMFRVLCAILLFIWAHCHWVFSLSLAMLVLTAALGEMADVVIQRTKYRIENFTWYVRNECISGRPTNMIRNFAYSSWDWLLAQEGRLATQNWVARLLRRTPYAELPHFHHSAISPAIQLRLLEIQRRRFFSLPTATLTVYNIGDTIPPFETVSFAATQPDAQSLPVIINNRRHSIPSDVHAIIHRLSNFFSPRYVWISTLCVNDEDEDEARLEHETTRLSLANSHRVLVCLGESRIANFAISVVNTLILTTLHSGVNSAAEYFYAFCELPRGTNEESCLDGFLGLLGHPWFEDGERFEEFMKCGVELTFLYGNEALMETYLMQIGQVFEAWDEERVRVALMRAGKDVAPWPPCAIPLFVKYTQDQRQREEGAQTRAAMLTMVEVLQRHWSQQPNAEDGPDEAGEAGLSEPVEEIQSSRAR